MSEPPPAVFLSYAREDTDAARRIAEALRAFGIEAWFDQNELRGGDTWDGKIRGQIRACTLFMPVVSGRTQSRAEGYFRREWKLAVERTHDMAAGVAFLVPVVIDDTPESEAAVPDEFMRVQWTRLPHGVPTPQFVEQIKRLLASPRRAAAAVRPATMGSPGPGSRPARFPRWSAAALIVGLGAVAYMALRPMAKEPAAAPKILAETKSAAPARVAPALSAKSIAVLPFANLSTEKENEFFADGVQDDVITNLAKIRDLTVISRTSTLAYRDPASRNLKKIAAELNVATVLEASVRRVGSKVHMNAQLIDARTDAHLWADTFDGDASDIFALQASLAQKIAAALKATLTPGERTLIERRPTQNQEAYAIYLRARAMQQELGEKGSPADYERIIAIYGQAITNDPSFALAHVQVALVHDIMYWFAFLDPSAARRELAKASVDAAVRLAPDLPETHLALGAYHYRIHRDWGRALAEFRAAEPGLPNDAQLYFWLAATHRRLGKWTEALGYFERAVALNPRDLSPVGNIIGYLGDLRRWDEARDGAARFLVYFPGERDLLLDQARARFALGGDREAYAAAIMALPRQPADPAGLGDGYRAALLRGDDAAVEQTLADPRLVNLPEPGSNVITDPVSLHRALRAFLRDEPAAARRFAGEAIAFYRTGQWNPRQQPWVQMRIAMAEAWSGRAAEALHDGLEAVAAMSAQDAYDAAHLRQFLGVTYISLGRREEALACLRELMAGPCTLSPNEVRLDPLWSRLKDDPRFEEILKAAKPL